MDSSTTRYEGQELVVAARNVKFDWTGVPLHYLPGEPVATQFFNFMHLVLPEAERAMAAALADALPYIDDERLREEVLGFIGQESMHASSHEGVRNHLARNGVPVQPIIDRMGFLIDGVLGGHGLTGRAQREWVKERLGLFAAMEHFTAFIGEWFLDNDKLDDMHPMMLDLIRWHGAEEIEHRNVVFDAYQYVDGSYARRVRTAVIGSGFLAAMAFGVAGYLVVTDPARDQRATNPILDFFGAVRRGKIPSASLFVTELPRYLNPGFHPSQMGPLDKAIRYLATSPAARAAQ